MPLLLPHSEFSRVSRARFPLRDLRPVFQSPPCCKDGFGPLPAPVLFPLIRSPRDSHFFFGFVPARASSRLAASSGLIALPSRPFYLVVAFVLACPQLLVQSLSFFSNLRLRHCGDILSAFCFFPYLLQPARVLSFSAPPFFHNPDFF